MPVPVCWAGEWRTGAVTSLLQTAPAPSSRLPHCGPLPLRPTGCREYANVDRGQGDLDEREGRPRSETRPASIRSAPCRVTR